MMYALIGVLFVIIILHIMIDDIIMYILKKIDEKDKKLDEEIKENFKKLYLKTLKTKKMENKKTREEIALILIETTAKYCVVDVESIDGKFNNLEDYMATLVKTSFLFADEFIKIRDQM